MVDFPTQLRLDNFGSGGGVLHATKSSLRVLLSFIVEVFSTEREREYQVP